MTAAWMISIHKALASLDYIEGKRTKDWIISIHKALASLDVSERKEDIYPIDFNPQGSREPRRLLMPPTPARERFQSTRLSRASTKVRSQIHGSRLFQSTRLSRASTLHGRKKRYFVDISIHKALASLDGKNAQLFLHLCHIYMLHIIHLLQIVYQVEISSRNLIVFSGQL